MMVRELGFEMKAQPSEKMKTPEEIAREEREKLQKLEVCVLCTLHKHKYIYFQICFKNLCKMTPLSCGMCRLTD